MSPVQDILFWLGGSSYFMAFVFCCLFASFADRRVEFAYLGLAFLCASLSTLLKTGNVGLLADISVLTRLEFVLYAGFELFLAAFVLAFFRARKRIFAGYLAFALVLTAAMVAPSLFSQNTQVVSEARSHWEALVSKPLLIAELGFTLLFAAYFKFRLNLLPRFVLSLCLAGALAAKASFDRPLISILFFLGVASTEVVRDAYRRRQLVSNMQRLMERVWSRYFDDYDLGMTWLLDEVRKVLHARRASLVLLDPKEKVYRVAFISGDTPAEAHGEVIAPHSICEQVLGLGQTMAVPNINHSAFQINELKRRYETCSFISAPLIMNNTQFGVLFISDPESGRSWYTNFEKPMMEETARYMGLLVHKNWRLEEMRNTAQELEHVLAESHHTLSLLAGSLEDQYHEEDGDTAGHTGGVVAIARGILQALKDPALSKRIVRSDFERDLDLSSRHFEQRLILAAHVHDIGKKDVPIELLKKPGKLNYPDEVQQVQGHGLAGYYILKGRRSGTHFRRALAVEADQKRRFGATQKNIVNYLDEEGRQRLQKIHANFSELPTAEYRAVEAVSHQEWFNGKGYPFALQAEEIPLVGRILSVADSVAVMKMRAIYSEPKTWEWAYFELETFSGEQFDPVVVEAAQHYIYTHVLVNHPESKRWVDEARMRGYRGVQARDFVPKTPKQGTRRAA